MPLTCLHANVRFNRSYDALHAARVRTGRALCLLPTQNIQVNHEGQSSPDAKTSTLTVGTASHVTHIPP